MNKNIWQINHNNLISSHNSHKVNKNKNILSIKYLNKNKRSMKIKIRIKILKTKIIKGKLLLKQPKGTTILITVRNLLK